jgi:magnesium transporter
MPKLTGKRSKKAGLPPGTLVHTGEEKTGAVNITVIEYDETNFQERELKTVEGCFLLKDSPAITWVDVEGIHQIDNIQKLGDCHNFHPLVLEDILNTDQRPKVEDHENYLYIVLKMLHYEEKAEVVMEQVSLILGPNFVFSFREGMGTNVFQPVRERIVNSKGRIRKMGADYLLYSLIDMIVDNYFVLLEKMGENIERLEEELIKDPAKQTLQRIHQFKREMIFLTRAVWPLREVVNAMERGESPLIKDSTRIYLRDIYDHVIRVIDSMETFRDLLSGMLDIYLSSISNRMNEIMKFLTIIGTIFIPLTFVVGIYGMNFEYMPELKWHSGYFVVLGAMAVAAISMLIYFKNKKWL